MKYIWVCRDEDGTLIKFYEKPTLVIPLDRNEKEYWDAKGEFEILPENEMLSFLDPCRSIALPEC